MNRTFVLAVTLTALGLPLHAQTRPTQEHGIKHVDEAFTRAFKANDAAALAAVYAPDAVFFPPGEMEQKGREAIRKGYVDFLAQFRIVDFTMTDAHYASAGDVSTGWGRWVLSAVPKGGGEPIRWEGRFAAVARRINGKWLYVADHASMPLGPPPQAPHPVSAPSR